MRHDKAALVLDLARRMAAGRTMISVSWSLTRQDHGEQPFWAAIALAAMLVGDGDDRHVTAEGLYAAAAGAAERVSLATVYNTLRAFCDAGLMNEVVVDGSKSYFDTRMDDHPHFYWEDSHALTDAPADALRIEGLPDAPAGMQVARVDVVIRLKRA